MFSNWTKIQHRVPQGCILDSLPFNVFLSDLFLFIPNIDLVSYVDDSTPFAMGSSELEVINEIKTVAEWKSKTRVKSYEFKYTSYEFKYTSYRFKSRSYEFKFTSYELKSTSWKTKSTSCMIKSTSWEMKSTSQEIKSTSQED